LPSKVGNIIIDQNLPHHYIKGFAEFRNESLKNDVSL